jgi:small subunit ribosomal protein S1
MSDPNEEDFAALFQASLKTKRIERGQTIEGTIVAIGPDVAFVDVGGKGEATIDIAELKDADGDIEVAVGERIQAVVVSTSSGLTLSRRLARGAATARHLEEAYRTGLAVEGKVEREVKGGYEVRAGHARGFCPFSQIDIVRTDAPTHLGRVYQFRVIEYRDGGRNLVLSRRALLEETQKAAALEVRKTMVPGAIVTGRVVSVRDFGAFVELGAGVQGLLHVSEMGWSRVQDASSVIKPGGEITVKVLAVDDGRQTISLGLKQLSEDPWSGVAGKYEIGQVRTGRVTRLADFGAFVELEPGIEALAHASSFPESRRREAWSTMVAPGTTAPFEIVSIDLGRKRIGVALVPEGSARARAHEAAAAGEESGQERVTPQQPTEGFGSLAERLRGALGPKQK